MMMTLFCTYSELSRCEPSSNDSRYFSSKILSLLWLHLVRFRSSYTGGPILFLLVLVPWLSSYSSYQTHTFISIMHAPETHVAFFSFCPTSIRFNFPQSHSSSWRCFSHQQSLQWRRDNTHSNRYAPNQLFFEKKHSGYGISNIAMNMNTSKDTNSNNNRNSNNSRDSNYQNNPNQIASNNNIYNSRPYSNSPNSPRFGDVNFDLNDLEQTIRKAQEISDRIQNVVRDVRVQVDTIKNHAQEAVDAANKATEAARRSKATNNTTSASNNPRDTQARPWESSATQASANGSYSDSMEKWNANDADWQKIAGCEVLFPKDFDTAGNLSCIVHFIGGAVVSAAPKESYGPLLKALSQFGCLIVATPVGLSFDHIGLAEETMNKFNAAMEVVRPRLNYQWIPVIGLGHSLGSKLHLLINSDKEVRNLTQTGGIRVANILMSYNNKSASESIPMYDKIQELIQPRLSSLKGNTNMEPLFNMLRSGAREFGIDSKGLDTIQKLLQDGVPEDFEPRPEQVRNMILESYCCDQNLVVKFSNDTIDESNDLRNLLETKYSPKGVVYRELRGNHLTPLTPDIQMQEEQLENQTDFGSAVRGRVMEQFKRDIEDLVVVIVAYIQLQKELINKRHQLQGSKD